MFEAVLNNPDLVLNLLIHLTSHDALSFALGSKAAAKALQTQLHQQTSYAFAGLLNSICCPRVLIVASGVRKLLEIPLTHDGRFYNSTQPITKVTGRAAPLCRRPPLPAVKRKCLNKKLRPGYAGWLTGIAVNPDDHHLYVCDYGASGVIKYSPNTLRRQQKFASAKALSSPEGIAFAAGTCYVVSSKCNSVAALDKDGKTKQVIQLKEELVAWGMTAWEPGGFDCARNPALFVAADVSYASTHYTQAPDTATGGVLCVKLSPDGHMLEPPITYSRVAMKRPSGLTFDHQGHMWVTSAQQQLLRLAGPMHSTPGVPLQTLNLPDLLPGSARGFYPFDVQAILKPPGSQLAAAAGDSRGLTLLVVTLHRGPETSGVVAVLELKAPALPVPAAADAGEPEQMHVRLVGYVSNDPALREPNMVAIVQSVCTA